jgi:hypothetical protein
MRLMNLSNATPRVYIKDRDIGYISQEMNLDEDTILEVFDYLSTREIVDIVVRN